jgi:hypothetical protein
MTGERPASERGPGVTVRVRGGRFEVYAATGTPAGELADTIVRLVPDDATVHEVSGGHDYDEVLIVFRAAPAASSDAAKGT